MLRRDQKLAIYMEGAVLGFGGKMGFGVLRYSPNPIVCVIDSQTAGRDMKEAAGMPRTCPIVATVEEAVALGAEVVVLGIAPPGGLIPTAWYPVIDRSVELGLSIVNGLHDLVGPRYPNLPAGQWAWDIRVEPEGLKPGTGAAARLTNRRVLLIGTDMAIGKMTAGLEVYRVARERGVKAEFVATGQIGITITGSGVPLDAVRVDFAAGAIEREVLGYREAELVIVEGQGSLGHPGSTANLALLRGSMPTHLILCHRAGQTTLTTMAHVPIAPLADLIRLYEDLASACGLFPRPVTVGVALNTGHVASDEEATAACAEIEQEIGLPCIDPVRHGPGRLIDGLMAGISRKDAKTQSGGC
jgi:uncharacterized NAD-dependent epimerase/dehydratase family protein